MYPQAHNIGAFIAAVDSGVAFNSIAAGTNDNTEKAGTIIDRTLHGAAQSLSIMIQAQATLAAGKSLFVGYRLEHGEKSDLSDTADFSKVLVGANKLLTSAGGGSKTGVYKVDLDLAGAGRYVRLNVTTDLDAANTDTGVAAAVLAFGGEDVAPAV